MESLGYHAALGRMVAALTSTQSIWTFGAEEMVYFVTAGKVVPFYGNSTTYEFSPREIAEAIQLIPPGKTKDMMSELYYYIYHDHSDLLAPPHPMGDLFWERC